MSLPILETPRLILRPTRQSDYEGFCDLHGNPRTARFLGGVQTPAMVWRTLRTLAGAWMLDGFAMFSVIEKQTGDFVGRVGPWRPHGWPGPEVGWSVREIYEGRGYATEAAIASMDFAFSHLNWADVCHVIDPDNHRSIRLAERLGSSRAEKVTLPAPLDKLPVMAWRQTKTMWQQNRQRLFQTA